MREGAGIDARRWVLSALFAVSLPAVAARADDIEPPPAACPPGSSPDASHAGPTCAPRPDCTSDADCVSGMRCVEARQCVAALGCGGRREDPGCFVESVLGACASDSPRECPEGSACRDRRVCAVLGGAGAPPPSASGSAVRDAPASTSCAASPSGARTSSALGLAAALALAAGRRARRRRSDGARARWDGARAATAALAVLAGLASVPARADVVSDTTLPTCPEGAVPRREHSVTYCAPGPACASDAECGAGRCGEVSFCLGETACGGDAPAGCRHETVDSTCAPGGPCPGGRACDTSRRCLPPLSTRGMLGCAAGRPRRGEHAPLGGILVALGAALVAARHRTPRRFP